MPAAGGRLRHIGTLLLLVLVAATAQAAPSPGKTVIAYGKMDGDVPGWTIVSELPAGWTADCCDHARWVGVPLLLYRGEWTGKPEGVIVLNVWPAAGKSLRKDLDEDRKEYLQRDPKAGVATLNHAAPRGMACRGVLYRGSDHVDDAVVFCDPGKRTGIHFSWSMSVDEADPARARLLARFGTVVAQSAYMPYQKGDAKPGMPAKQ